LEQAAKYNILQLAPATSRKGAERGQATTSSLKGLCSELRKGISFGLRVLSCQDVGELAPCPAFGCCAFE